MIQYDFIDKETIEEMAQFEEDMPEELVGAYVYNRGFHDIGFFSDYFLTEWKRKGDRYIQTPKFHYEIWDLLTDEARNDINVIIARGHGKTTSLLIYMIRRICYFPNYKIIYVAGRTLGEEGIGKIRRELEVNEKILHYFGNLVPVNSDDKKDKALKKWRQKELEFLNGARIVSLSKGQAVRGQRPDEIVVDDPQENGDVVNPIRVQQFNNWFFTSLYNVLLETGRVACLGTIIGNMCLVKHLRDDKKWLTVEYQACDENFENVLWEDMWSKEALKERRDGKMVIGRDGVPFRQEGIGSANFNQEYRNIPLTAEDRVIKENWIRRYSAKAGFDYVIMTIDPAVKTKESSDFTGICVLGISEGKKYVIWSKSVKLSPRDLQDFVIELNKRFKPNIIVKEDNIEVKLTDDLKAKGLPIKAIRAHNDKFTRLLGVAGMIEVGDVYFKMNGQETLIEQLTNFPDVAHDDELDAFVYALIESQEYLERGGTDGGVLIV